MAHVLTLLCLPALVAQVPPIQLPWLCDGHNPVLVLVAPTGTALRSETLKILRDPELADLELSLRMVDAPPSELANKVRAGIPGLACEGWALLSNTGVLLTSGHQAPSAQALLKALSAAGVTPPLTQVKAFLRDHPDHLEARDDLLRLLRKGAVARTLKTLMLDGTTPEDRLRTRGQRAVQFHGSSLPDPGPFRGKRLSEEEDLRIWAPYAQELDRSFRNGTWPALQFQTSRTEDVPVEVCSPLMQALYRRHLPKLEAALEAMPSRRDLWRLWGRFQILSEHFRAVAFLQGLTPPPPELGRPWPPTEARPALALEARLGGDWRGVRDLLEGDWKHFQAYGDVIRTAKRKGGPLPFQVVDWEGTLGPLLESMLRLGSSMEARELVDLLRLLDEGPSLVEHAAALAATCARPDLAKQWRSR